MKAKEVSQTLRVLANPEIAEHSQRFFKTGKGEYGEGDRFLGIRVPELRKVAKQCRFISFEEVLVLLKSPFHEERLCSLFLLVDQFRRNASPERRRIYTGYLNHTEYINNWDLVDGSAHHIVGAYLEGKSRKPLYRLVESSDLWERRISIMSTFHFIRNHDFDDALELSKKLLNDREDLIHKVVGWMLREIGKRDLAEEERFLKEHYQGMPRTMLRYAIEKFPEQKRLGYLKGTI